MSRTYEAQAQSAQRAIEKNGYPVTFYTPAVTGGTNPNTGDPIPDTPRVERSGDGLVFGYRAGEIDGGAILMGDAYVLYSGEKPDKDMLFDQATGKQWRVVSAEPLAPTNTVILYKVQIRR